MEVIETNKFSVAMSVYQNDSVKFFDRALESITDNQTVKPTEIVIVKDGPVDIEIDKVIEKYKKKYFIKVVAFENNQGLGQALRQAVESSTYNLIARMDSDDVSYPTRFEQQLKLFKLNPNVDIVAGDITEFIDGEENIVAKRCVPQTDEEIKKYMKKRCGVNHVTVMFKKEKVLKAGNYKDWFWNEDYYLWIRLILCGAVFMNTKTSLVNVRVGNDMYKRRGGIKYFKSELGIQKLMYSEKMISRMRYMINVLERFVLQVIMPNWLRGFVFRKFARKGNELILGKKVRN